MSKCNENHTREALEWIRAVTGENITTSGDVDNLYETLEDGTLLCRLVNELKPDSVKKINTYTMAFKCMENINNFLATATMLGVPTQELFQTVALMARIRERTSPASTLEILGTCRVRLPVNVF